MEELKACPSQWNTAVKYLNAYRNSHYNDPISEDSYWLANAINDILPFSVSAHRRAEPENKPLITVEQVQEFYEFLQGNIPYNDAQKIIFIKPPKISKATAVDIIYYLQEVAHIIPDTYESCKRCGDFFDSDNDGCLAGFCECCGCQHPEFVEQEDGCVKCEESLYARKPEGSKP
jgi:hypothetical protein